MATSPRRKGRKAKTKERETKEERSSEERNPNLERLSATIQLAEETAEEGGEKLYTATFYGGEPVLRYDYMRDEEYYLVLGMEKGEVDLSQLNAGAPILDNHGTWNLSSIVGNVVENSAESDGSKGTLQFRLSSAPDVLSIRHKVDEGTIKATSVGTTITKTQDVTKEGDKLRTIRAVKHSPHEMSLVVVGASPGAQVHQSALLSSTELNGVTLAPRANHQEDKMSKETENKEGAGTQADAPDIAKLEAEHKAELEKATAEAAEKATRLEGERRELITERFAHLSIGEEHLNKALSEGWDIDKATKFAFAEAAKRDEEDPSRNYGGVTFGGQKEEDTIRECMGEALQHRYVGNVELTEKGREFRQLSAPELVRWELGRDSGFRSKAHRMTGDELYKEAFALHSTGQFPKVLANTANKVALQSYEEAPTTYQAWCKQMPFNDFRQRSHSKLGEISDLPVVPEGKEIEFTTVTETKEVSQLATYGARFGLTRQAFINDDLGEFMRLVQKYGNASAHKAEALVYTIINTPSTLQDGLALFLAAATRGPVASITGNLVDSGGAPSVAALSVGREQMRLQKGLDGTTKLNNVPKYAICGPQWETEFEQILGMVTQIAVPATDATVNPFRNKLELVVTAELTGTDWYLAADPNRVDTIIYGQLNGGANGIMLDRFETSGFDGFVMRGLFDFAAAPLDFRGLFRNDGA